MDAKVWGLDAKHEALRVTVWALRARLGRFGFEGFGVAGGSISLGYRFDEAGSQLSREPSALRIVPDTFSQQALKTHSEAHVRLTHVSLFGRRNLQKTCLEKQALESMKRVTRQNSIHTMTHAALPS